MSEMDDGKIEELLRLTRDNNEMLHSMRRRMFWSQFFSYVYWLIIVGAMGWSYYFLQPYFDKYWQMYQGISAQLSNIEAGGMSLPADLKSLLEKVK
jgi:hypothetical protein